MAPRVLALSLVAAMTTAISAQQGPTFRAQVELIQLDAFVTDGAGNPVTNLRVEDFELLEDGKAQTITTFSAVNIPIEAPPPFSPSPARADVATNGGRDGRFYIIAVDEIDPAMALRARHHLRTFIERHFEPNDVGVVVNVGRARASGAQDVTSDRALLLAAIDRLSGWPPPFPGPPSLMLVAQRQRAAALKALVASLAAIPGRRKALIYLTHNVGDVFDVIDYKGGVRSLEFEDLRAAMTDAMRGGVAIYTMDPCGLAPLGGTIGESFGDAAPYQPLPLCDVKIDRTMNFRMLSSATGGFALVNSNNFGDAFERIVRENSSYYILGYVSTNDRQDGRYRRLDVRARPPGLTVRTRDGYIAPVQSRPTGRAGTTTAGIGNALASPLANGTVPMSVFAAPFKGSKGKEALVLITAELDPSRLELAETEGLRRGRIELAAAAVSAAGKVTRNRPAVIDLSLSPEAYAEVMEQGLRLRTSLMLLPGRYQLRVAGGNTQNGKIGSVMYDLDVPDFDKGPLTMSAAALLTTTGDPTMSTVEREFAGGTRLALYAEVYDNVRGRGPRTIDLEIGVRNDEGRIVRTVSDRRTRTAPGTETVDAGVPLDMEAGRYVVRVEATSGDATVSRDIPIVVR